MVIPPVPDDIHLHTVSDLVAQLPSESKEAVQEFIDEHRPSKLHNAEAVLEALRRIKVCDPACGSGAYLVGMQHELLDLRACLFATAKLDTRSVYERKLEIIQNNLYGVDLDQFAVNIARLRLWLSLSVDFEGEKPPPLPNLDYKVEAGDTICSPNPSGGLELGFRKALIDEYLKTKAEYMTAHHSRKVELRSGITKLRFDIATWGHKKTADGFDWPVEFAEVFVDGGFDVVLANPPYVRQELITELKPSLKRVYPDAYDGTADLYCYFYIRGVELLKNSGMLVFISSNKWLRAGYGANLRAFLSKNCGIKGVVDFGELPVFESAATFPMILIAQNQAQDIKLTSFTQVRSLDPPYPDVGTIVKTDGYFIETEGLRQPSWSFANEQTAAILKKMSSASVPLQEYAYGNIFRGIVTGCNSAFVIDKETKEELARSDKKSLEIIKPFVTGDEVRKWRLKYKGNFLGESGRR